MELNPSNNGVENEDFDSQEGELHRGPLSRGTLADLVDYRNGIQKFRIMAHNRAEALGGETAVMHGVIEKRFKDMETDLESRIRDEMRNHPTWPWIRRVHGLAELAAAQVVSEIDITNKKTISQLWRYAGYAVIDGRREYAKKGEKLHYNRRLKTYVYRVTSLQVRLNGPYAKIYRDAKHRYMTLRGPESSLPKDEQWTKGRCELAARRKASKLFLSHLCVIWWQAVGMPVSDPYVSLEGERHDIIDPWKFIEDFEEEKKSAKKARKEKAAKD